MSVPVGPFHFGEDVTWISRVHAGTDADGNDLFTDVPTTFTQIAVWPRDGNAQVANEKLQAGDLVITGVTALLPPGTPVKAVDRLQLRGHLWDVYGDPNEFHSPLTGTASGVAVSVSKVTG